MNQRKIGWGLIGTGGICGAMSHALAQLPDARLVAVGSRTPERAQAFAARRAHEHRDIRAHGSYEALVNDPEVDVVYVGTPHTDHAASAALALRAGKAVLCEKPFTLTQPEALALVQLARERRVFLMEAMWTRFVPAVAQARRWVQDGAIGEPLAVLADFGLPFADFPPEHRVLNRQLGGGALLDLGIYPLSLASFMLGPVASAQARAQLAKSGVDLHTAFSLTHANGAFTQALCSFATATAARATVLGREGRIELQPPFYRAHQVTIKRHGAEPQTLELPHVGEGYSHQIDEVHRCLRAGALESAVMPLDESVALMQWMDTMRAQLGVHYPGE